MKITLADVILEMQPFSDELVDWCKKHKDFFAALKNLNPSKFISPAMITTTYPPTGDEVIGVYTYHYELRNPIFKQDFIVNVGKSNKLFILYTRNPKGSSKFVKDINDFYTVYGKYGYTKESHHLTLDELPIQLRSRAKEAIHIADRLKIGVPQEISQDHIDKIYNKVMRIKRKDRFYKQELKIN